MLPALASDGIQEAFAASQAKKVVVSNLVTKPGQTTGWHAVDYVKTLEEYVGNDQIDYVLYNDRLPSSDLLSVYIEQGEFPVGMEEERFSEIQATAISADLIAKSVVQQDPNDKLIKRTLIRHDAHMVGRKLMSIFYS